jgi:iron complex outermembrane receptor protein
MKKFIITCVGIIYILSSYAQYDLKLAVKNVDTRSPLGRATGIINSLKRTAIADSSGLLIFKSLPAGTYRVRVTFIDFEEEQISISIPQVTDTVLEILLKQAEHHEEEVIVTATRTSRAITDIPTRVEIISGEEVSEKANMKPGEIRMLLNESTGIQTQQTSATSYNSSIRIQGLDGRYTQLLRDGFPLYSGFSGGLSLMQIAPLDLKQVEVIKGSSSTLYGGGAIAGLVNLVSKTPGTNRELNLIANATSAKGLDLSGFFSQKFNKIGLTVFTSRNSAAAYDPADIGLTAIPKFERYTINPRVFFYGNKTNANLGVSFITENRIGGSMNFIKDGLPGYFEKNNSDRVTAQLDVQHKITETSSFNLKTSYSWFNREITIPTYTFEGLQQSSFTELNYSARGDANYWIAGINFLTEDFLESQHNTTLLRNYHFNTIGVFVQNTWSPLPLFTLETGLRGDHVNDFGMEVLPRISALFKFSPALTARLGGGMGYKTPTVFNEEAERVQFQNIAPINKQTTRNERSIGGNLDINYRTRIGEIGLTINQLFFYTKLKKPLILTSATPTDFNFINANGDIDTKGIETNLRFTYLDFKLFIGYTYADVNTYFNGIKGWFPLTARHRLNNVLLYEKEDSWKIGLEAYYFSPQRLTDGSAGRSYWIFGFMVEKLWKKLSIFINFENFTDTRQTRFDSIFSGSIDNPMFKDIYAPVDGFVINGGIKIRL